MSAVNVQQRANSRMWRSARRVRAYESATLRPAEVAVLDALRDDLGGRVLEIGCGAGRVTGHLARLSDDLHAFDISSAMLTSASSRYPGVSFAPGDLRDMSGYADASFDAVTIRCNVLDILGPDERGVALAEVARMLRPRGVAVLCTHNLESARLRRMPTTLPAGSARQRLRSLAGMPLSLFNHLRLARHESAGDGYAILNDEAHRFAALHYYVSIAEQQRQFAAAGLELDAIFDARGARLTTAAAPPDSPDLHFIARRC